MLDKTDDIAVAAEHWLAQFEVALSGADFRALAHLFVADSYWRDVLALSWTLQTWNGADAINIILNYSHDTTGFFTNNPTAKATLQLAANDLASQISAALPAITPSSGNSWSETFFDPATGQVATVNNPSVASGSAIIRAFPFNDAKQH